MTDEDHKHSFVFLRQEKRNIGYDRNPTWLVEDVYYCKECLEYCRVGVEKQTPKNDSGVYIERLV